MLGARTLVMGVLNVTPNSFSDGGVYLDSKKAIQRAFEIEREGADILDIGGESTRPGSDPVSADEELARVLPVLQALQGRLRIPISLDTQKAVVAQAGIAAGVEIINDVSALRSDPELGEVVRRGRAALVLMHMRGTPKSMHKGPFARDVLRDVTVGLRSAIKRAEAAGISRLRIIADPGIGFGKRFSQNCELLAHLNRLAKLGCPLLVGTSRKAFLGHILADAPNRDAERSAHALSAQKRQWGTAATVAAAILAGAHIVRVHDVPEMAQVARIADAIANACNHVQKR